VGKPLLKAYSKLESIQFYGEFSKFSQLDMTGSRGTHFDVRYHMHLHACPSQYFSMRVCQVASLNFNAMRGSRKH
jgi:hypothetical protein